MLSKKSRVTLTARVAQRFINAEAMTVVAAAAYISSTKYPDWTPEHTMVQEKALSLKKGDKSSAFFFARILSSHPLLRNFKGIVTPAPRSTGARPSNLGFAQSLVANGVGSTAMLSVRRIEPVESSRERRHRGLPGVPKTRHEETMSIPTHLQVDKQMPFLIVDDVLTTGATLKAVARQLRRAGFTGPIMGAVAGYYVADPTTVPKPLEPRVIKL